MMTPREDAVEVRFDYARQAWTVDGRYIRCGHPDDMRCGCYGREHEGELVWPSAGAV